ncbi:response regulator transcription factor [bacterium SCSIO 12741]|nr:response regulator transcription factor [bacterium SCSIO 12741]
MAVREVAEGKVFMSPEAAESLLHRLNTPSETEQSSRYSLTERELDVLQEICKGKTTAEIAESLFISEHTVKTHRKKLIAKLPVNNATGLVRFAIDNGLC